MSHLMMPDEAILTAPVVPDSRLTDAGTPKGARWRGTGYWVPIFCASCGTPGGEVPQENMTFIFWLCTPCFERYGVLTNMMVTPDEVFWERLRQEQMEKYGRLLSADELLAVHAADASPLATLLREGR